MTVSMSLDVVVLSILVGGLTVLIFSEREKRFVEEREKKTPQNQKIQQTLGKKDWETLWSLDSGVSGLVNH